MFGFISYTTCGKGQIIPEALDPQFDKVIKRYLQFSVTPISVNEAKANENILFLDARELEEYEISHIKGARHIGFENFSVERLRDINSHQKIVLYCSMGYRSEKIGEKLKAMGFSNVYNLYGSIFEWVNNGFPVYDMQEKPTRQIHTYSKAWSKWVDGNLADKRW